MSKVNQNSHYGPIQLCHNILSVFKSFSVMSLYVWVCGLQRAEYCDSSSVTYLWKKTAALLLASLEIFICWSFSYSKESWVLVAPKYCRLFRNQERVKVELVFKGVMTIMLNKSWKICFRTWVFRSKTRFMFILKCLNQQDCGKWCINARHWLCPTCSLLSQEGWSLMSNAWVKQLSRAK